MLDPAWVALSLTERIGGKTLRALLAHFNGDMAAVLKADAAELRRVPGVGKKIAAAVQDIDLARVEAQIQAWQAGGIRILTSNMGDYPPLLRRLDDAPPTLFVMGEWRAFWHKSVAIVGTRRPTEDAQVAATLLSMELTERGYSIISGLALGIDAAAHTGALTSPKGYTVAVLGSGVWNVYPPTNAALANSILQRGRGIIISELHPKAETSAANLVARNRIISGLSQALIVVETSRDGGAMYAARFALEQGRRVYTLDSAADGNRALLDAGAMPLDLSALPAEL